MATQTYNRLLKGNSNNVMNMYIDFNGKKLTVAQIEKMYPIIEIVKGPGNKPYSIYFAAPIIKGVRRE